MNTARSVLILALLAVSARGDDWTHLGRDDGRTRAPVETIGSPGLLGVTATGSETIASPVASDGFLITCGLDGAVRAYREDNRALLWTVPTGAPIISTPLISHGRVFVPSTDGTLRILKLADGASLGSVDTGGSDYSSPVMSGNLLLLGSGFPNTSLIGVDSLLKTVAWSATLDQVTQSSPATSGGKVVIATNNGTLSAFDAASGASVWNSVVGGAAGASSPLILATSVYLLVDGTLTRMDLDTGNATGSLTMTDAAPPDTLSVQWSCSPLASMGGLLMGVVRFEYALDHDHDGYVDAWTIREVAFAADPATMTLAWQTPLGSLVDVGLNSIPPYRLVPSPVFLGTSIAFASSLDPSLRLLTPAGSPASSIALDAPCLASPMLANARLYALTRTGRLYAFEDPAGPQPAVVAGLSPSGLEFSSTPPTLSWSSAGPGATYRVRIASDGDIFMDWDYEFVTGATSIACPALADRHLYTWGVRVLNPAQAYAPWSLATFAQNVPPQPPGSLTATPRHASVLLAWTPSPSPTAVGYRVAYGPTGGALGPAADLGNVLSTTVTGLANGTSYTFELRAMDALPDVSTPLTVNATPVSAIHIGGTAYDSLAAAMAAALPGQTILLGAESFLINAPLQLPRGVELLGANARDTRIVASGAFQIIDALAGSSIRLLALSGGSVGVKADENGVTIANCVIRDMTDAGVDVTGVAQVINNTIVNNTVAGLRASGRADARNNIVQQNGVGFTGVVVSSYNDVSDGYAFCAPGAGDLNAPVVFLDAASGDFREQTNQPSLDAGSPGDDYSQEPALNGGRINMGAFGNTPLAATSLTAGPPRSPGSSRSGCGLTGLEVVMLLLLFRRRR
jgi:outer membrane protein assembly factor BamB